MGRERTRQMPDERDNRGSGGVSRRGFLQAGAAVTGAALLEGSGAAAAVAAGPTKRPNLVLILGEGHRWDCLSVAGHPIVKTPHHDRIGNEGVRFENAFCTNALCAPARSAVLTGM